MSRVLEIDLTEKRGESCAEEPLIRFALVATNEELDSYDEVILRMRKTSVNPEVVKIALSRRGFSCLLEEESEVTAILRCKKVDNPSQ